MDIIRRPSPNFDPRPAGTPVDMLVLHYTGMESAGAALDRLCDPASKVSAHYLIDEDGGVHELVAEADRAWHAGVARWRGETDVNGRSIGIELVNPGHEFGYRPFTEAQMSALLELAAAVLHRHPIPAGNVVGHSDVAPTRKMDPGELFDWRRMARAGIGLWPEPAHDAVSPAESDAAAMLGDIGYELTDRGAAVTAFQRHYRPARMDGVLDAETRALVAALWRARTR